MKNLVDLVDLADLADMCPTMIINTVYVVQCHTFQNYVSVIFEDGIEW